MAPALVLALLAAEPGGTVTLSLPPGLALLAPAGKEDPPAPPLPAAVVGQRLSGRLSPDALEVTAAFTVTVLEGARWSRLALLEAPPGLVLLDAPRVEGGLVAVQGREVVLVTRTPGTLTVELRVAVPAAGPPGARTARLCRGKDALEGPLRLEADGEPEGLALASAAGCWTATARGPARTRAVERPPLEPGVTGASARLVSTMEGKARLTVEYALRLDREQPLALALPEGWQLRRLAVNDAPLPLPPGGAVTVAVRPAPGGDHQGRLAVTLERDYGVLHLSGRLGVALPGLSWPTAVVDLEASLPAVFEYHRVGGSLEPGPAAAEAPASSDTPGKRLGFRQHLVGAAGPTLELRYSVDLEHRYFSVRGSRP